MNTKTIEFDMKGYVDDLCGFVRGENALGSTVTHMPSTIIDACCETPEFADRCDLEVKDLLTRDRIIELMESDDFDAEKLMLLIAEHRGDLLNLGEVIDRYARGLAEDVAYTTIKHEMEA